MGYQVYVILGVLGVFAFAGIIVYTWANMALNAIAAFGACILAFGLELNFAGLRHAGSGWSLLPSWVYDLPDYAGLFILMVVGISKLAKVSRKEPEPVNDDKKIVVDVSTEI
jgi:hypothetical protein